MKQHGKKPIFALVIISILGVILYLSLNQKDNGIYYGEVQADSYDICATVPGIIKEITVTEGDEITASTIVVRLDDEDAKLSVEKASLADHNAQLQAIKASSPARQEELKIQRNTIAQLEEQKAALRGNQEKVKITLSQAELSTAALKERYDYQAAHVQKLETLWEEGFESKQNLDLAKIELTSAKNAYESAKLQLASIQQDSATLDSQMKALDLQIASANEGFTMLTTGLDSSEQQMAENSSQIAKLELQRSQLLLSKYSIASSVDGIVESINYQQGEFVNTGTPVISLVHKEKRHVTIYVQEKDLPSIYVGDKLFFSLVSNEAVTLEGTVTKISEKAMFTPMNIVTTKDRARLVFPVELSLAPSDALASGMLLQTELHKGE